MRGSSLPLRLFVKITCLLMVAIAVRRGGCHGRGEGAGLPEADEVLKPAKEAGEAGHDEGVQGCRQPATGRLRLRREAHAGDGVGQGGWLK